MAYSKNNQCSFFTKECQLMLKKKKKKKRNGMPDKDAK